MVCNKFIGKVKACKNSLMKTYKYLSNNSSVKVWTQVEAWKPRLQHNFFSSMVFLRKIYEKEKKFKLKKKENIENEKKITKI